MANPTKEQIQALNPKTSALWLAAHRTLSVAQMHALVIACRDGGFVAAGRSEHKGHVERVSAKAIIALVRRGILESCYASEGGVAGTLSQNSLDRLSGSV